MELKEKKKKIRAIKKKEVIDNILNVLKTYISCEVLLICIIMPCAFMSYFFYTKSAERDINEYWSNLFISVFTSLLTGSVLYVFVNFNVKNKIRIDKLNTYINEIEDKVFELYGVIELLMNDKGKNIYDKFNIKIGTWFEDFIYIKVKAYIRNEKKEYKGLVNTINNEFNDLRKEYDKVWDDKSLLQFCRDNKEKIIKWSTDIANYKSLVQKKLDVIDKSILINK